MLEIEFRDGAARGLQRSRHGNVLDVGWPDDVLARMFADRLGGEVFTLYGAIDPLYAPIAQMTMIVAAEWLVCLWLYRQKAFLRL